MINPFRRKQVPIHQPIPRVAPVKPEPKPKKEKKGCDIEIKKTKTGKKISISEGCSREQVRAFSEKNGIDLNEDSFD